MSAPGEHPHVLVAGRYRLSGVLGRGGMAVVYEAHDETLGRDVAVKVYRVTGQGEDELRRQHTEVAVLATLSHHNLVTLLDAGVDEDVEGRSAIYLVMELVRGPDLKQRIAEGPLSSLEVAQIGYDLAEGLEYLATVGVVHRDIKPANILLADPGSGREARAKLTDFGIADLEGREPQPDEVTTGTAAYLSPEQARREPVDSASDVYSLGLVLLECLTGFVAFPGDLTSSALRRLTEDPPIPAELPAFWREIIAAMTAREPSARPSLPDLVLAFRQAAAAEVADAGSGPHQADVVRPRSSALARTLEVDPAAASSFDRVTALAARVLGVPVAAVAIADAERAWLAPHSDTELAAFLGDGGHWVAAILRETTWIADVDDPTAAENPLLLPGTGVGFYAGVPLRTRDGHAVGTLCVLDRVPRRFSGEDTATLEDLAAMLTNELELRAAGALLTVALG